MATQTENAVINLVINGQQAISTYRELNQARTEQLRLVQSLNRNDPHYAEQAQRLEELNAAHREWRAELNAGARAQQQVTEAIQDNTHEIGEAEQKGKGFFGAFKEGFAEMAGNITAATLIFKGLNMGIDFVKDLWNGSEAAYSEAVKGQAQLQAVLTSTGGVAGKTEQALGDLSTELMNLTGIDDDVVTKGEEVLLTFTNIRGKIYDDAIPAIIDMASALNQGSVNMENIQATTIQVGKALNDPIKGMTALAKVGVTFNDQQKEQIRTLVESNKVQAAQAIILRELQKEFGGTAKAIADTQDVGKIQRYETAMGNLQEKMGAVSMAGKAFKAELLTPLVEELGRSGTFVEHLTEDFYKQKDAVAALEKNTAPLIDRYEELTSKGALNKKEQAELNSIIDTLSKTIPSAVTQWDKYGNAIGINTDKARDFIKMQKAMLEIQNKAAIEETEKFIKDAEDKSNRIQAMLAAGKKTIMQGAGNSDAISAQRTRALTDKEILDASRELGEIQTRIESARLGIKGLKGENIAIPEATKGGGAPQGGKSEDQLKKDADAAKRAREQALKDRQAYTDAVATLSAKLEDFDQKELASTLNKNDKEIADLRKKYDDEISMANATLAKLRANKNANQAELDAIEGKVIALRGQKVAAVNALEARQEEDLVNKLAAFREKMSGKLQTELDKEKAAINQFYDGLEDENAGNEDALAKITINRALAVGEAEIREAKRVQKEKDDLQKDADEKTKASEAEKHKAIKDSAIQSAESIANAVFSIGQSNRQAETDQKLNQLEKEREAELSKKNLTEKQKKAINDKYDAQAAAIKLQQWEADKQSALTQAAINGALAVIKALPNIPLSIAAGVAAAAQVAIIASTEAPKFADGGILPDGPSHTSGGINLVGPYGRVYGNIEGGEPILSRQTYANNRSVIDALMSSGGQRLDLDRVFSATTNREARRSFSTSTGTPVAGSSSTTQGNTNVVNSARLDRIERMLEMQAKINETPVVLSRRESEQEDARIVAIRNKANP